MGKVAIVAGLISFFTALLVTRGIIYLMNSREVGQYIRSWGPKVHEHKSGTPTMGGVAILSGLAATVPFLWYYFPSGRNDLLLLLLGTFGFGFIGFLDDFFSIKKGEAEGLPPRGKLIAQIGLGILFVYLALTITEGANQLLLPFSSLIWKSPPLFYALLTIFILVSTVNAVNLTDGLDGLAAGAVTISVLGFLAISGESGAPLFIALIAGILGFLWYNFYPAEIFMGDTGAFALGGFLVAAAVITGTELFLPLLGGLFVLDTLSVIFQVAYYRSTGGRIFKISPLHHHFEAAEGIDYGYLLPELEWDEPKITARLLILHGIIAGIGLFGYFGWVV